MLVQSTESPNIPLKVLVNLRNIMLINSADTHLGRSVPEIHSTL